MSAPKICKDCLQKPVRTENRKGRIYQKADCSNCHNKKTKRNNPEKYRAICRKSKNKCKAKNIIWLSEYMQGASCKVCNESDKATLDFHHRNPDEKKFCISDGLKYSLDSLKLEIAKCDILCANCHLRHHATNPKNHNWVKKKKILDVLEIHNCSHCNEEDIRVLVFHHPSSVEKLFTIAKERSRLNLDSLIAEAKKCEVLCQNCHRKLHSH